MEWGRERRALTAGEAARKRKREHAMAIVDRKRRRKECHEIPDEGWEDSRTARSGPTVAPKPSTDGIYVVFPRQSAAFSYLDDIIKRKCLARGAWPASLKFDNLDGLKIVSFETNSHGQRKFVCCTLKLLWERLLRLPPRARHYYEIVREDTPCRLYFDLEYDRTRNRSVSGGDLIEYFIFRASRLLEALYGFAVERSGVVDLDSTTESKFSRHLIFSLPRGALFRSHQHAGEFVLALAEELEAERCTNPLADALWLASADGPRQFIADLAVYTKNRAMRLYLSCKYGKRAVLLPSAENRFRPAGDLRPPSVVSAPFSAELPVQVGDAEWEEAMWASSFITGCLPPLSLVQQLASETGIATREPGGEEGEGGEGGEGGGFQGSPNPASHPVSHVPLLYLWPPAEGNTRSTDPDGYPEGAEGGGILRRFLRLHHPPPRAKRTRGGTASRVSSGASPFPPVDAFVEQLASVGGVPGRIRAWEGTQKRVEFERWGSDPPERVVVEVWETLAFQIAGNRFCRRIGRAHKSNHVSYHVDLPAGLVWQTCLDPECSGFRSEAVRVPLELLPDQAPAGGPWQLVGREGTGGGEGDDDICVE